MKIRECKRFPRLAKAGLLPFALNESVNLAELGGPFSNEEYAEMIMEFGETDDIMSGGWLLPDGTILDLNRRSFGMLGAKRHSAVFNAFSPSRKQALLNHMSEKDLLYDDDSIVVDVCTAAGMIRYHIRKFRDDMTAYFAIEKRPTDKQASVLREAQKLVADDDSSRFIGIVECVGRHMVYDTQREFGLRFMNDILEAAR